MVLGGNLGSDTQGGLGHRNFLPDAAEVEHVNEQGEPQDANDDHHGSACADVGCYNREHGYFESDEHKDRQLDHSTSART